MSVSNFSKTLTVCAILSFTLLMFSDHLDYVNSGKFYYMWENKRNLRYILTWSKYSNPLWNVAEGQEKFIERRCSFTNCYISQNKQLLGDVADFDVILFYGPELPTRKSLLPQSRSPHQKYIYINGESSANYPVCNRIFNGYFNWTVTYKLDSDEYYGYIRIRDKEGKVIGPKIEMHWENVKAMIPLNDTLKAKLSTKKIAAAWFVSNCGASSGRDLIVRKLRTELAKYNMKVDIFGKCGTKKCPRSSMKECLQKLETDYYFYLSFENSLAEDYVTEKLLRALKHYTIPVVYGGANYTRFMPNGIYLSAQKSRIRELAKEMVDIINDKQKYYNFFKWHNHYTYHSIDEYSDTDNYCRLCAIVNNQEKYLRTSVHEDFIQWWISPEHVPWPWECDLPFLGAIRRFFERFMNH